MFFSQELVGVSCQDEGIPLGYVPACSIMKRHFTLALGSFLLVPSFACSGGEPNGVPGEGTGGALGATGGQGNSSSGGAGAANPGAGGSGALSGSGGSDGSSGGAQSSSGGTVGGGEVHVAVDNCNETAVSGFDLSGENGRYGVAEVEVNGGAKSYIMATNWWSSYNGQSTTGSGNNFRINGDAGDANINEGAPAGYPTLYLGSYNGNSSTGSNLPKLVTELNSVPTVFRTNGTQHGMDYYNAAYDVWLTATSNGVPNGQYDPGQGGAYLMVWTFDPENKRPRGPGEEPQFSAMTIPGVTGTFDVWVDDTDPPCISYVATEPVDDLGFDLKHFIDDSVQNGYGITNEMYLAVVFAGFEVWSGGDGLEVEEFCVDVQ